MGWMARLNPWNAAKAAAKQEAERAAAFEELKTMFDCPCCGYRDLTEKPGNHDICGICFWQDCGVRDDEDYSGPNHITLGEGRRNYKDFGACDRDMLPQVVPPTAHQIAWKQQEHPSEGGK